MIRQLPDGVKIEHAQQGVAARFNAEGFWCSFRSGNSFYRHCMNGDVVEASSGRIVNQALASDIFAGVAELCDALVDKADPDVREVLAKAIALTQGDFDRRRLLFNQVFPESVPVLPPDRYRDLVIPLTTGCPNGQCTFCAFYKNHPFALLDKAELNSRIDKLLKIVPSGLAGREGVFLGSANALAVPVSDFSEALNILIARWGYPARGIACFGDADRIGRRTAEDWNLLYRLGLRLVVIGLETGSADLREQLGKSGRLERTSRLVRQLRSAGIRVGLTVLAGICDKGKVCEHLHATSAFVQSLNLTGHDRTYISPWFSGKGEPSLWAFDEASQLKSLLKSVTPARVTLYSSHNFHYFS